MAISVEDFQKVEIRVGTVRAADEPAGLKVPAYRLRIDFGEDVGQRESSAQLTQHYRPEDLIGRQVLAVLNFPPKQVGPIRSECLVVGVPDSTGAPVLVGPDRAVPDGGQLF